MTSTEPRKGRAFNGPRLHDAEGYRLRAGAVVFRIKDKGNLSKDQFDIKNHVEILLVSSQQNPYAFTIPSGGVEQGESGEESAKREVREEAGVDCGGGGGSSSSGKEGSCHRLWSLGVFVDEAKRTKTDVYALMMDEGWSRELPPEEWQESNERRRQWFAWEDALKALAWRPCVMEYLLAFERNIIKSFI